MALHYEWHSFSGSLTDDNRDCCGIAERPDAWLAIVVDGSTTGPHGGELARELACRLVDGFLASDPPVTEQQICDLLRKAHEDLRLQYPADSASYFIAVHGEQGSLMTLHAGDCRIGRVGQDNAIEWLSGVHTLANATAPVSDAALAVHPGRHLLTRSFRPRQFEQPECGQCSLMPDEELVIATDGFWAGMDAARQADFIEGKLPASDDRLDDGSCLLLRQEPDGSAGIAGKVYSGDNIYIRSIGDVR
jgi:serine/threonine protein phosphatase PrpC